MDIDNINEHIIQIKTILEKINSMKCNIEKSDKYNDNHNINNEYVDISLMDLEGKFTPIEKKI